MKKVTILSIVLLIFTVVTSAFAGDVTPSWKSLGDTTWVGVLTFVHPDGSTNGDNATLTFGTENGKFLYGTIACKEELCELPLLDPDGTSLSFSGIKNGNQLLLTADGYSIFAVLSMGRPAKRGNPPPQYMMVEGSHLVGGDTFIGRLSKQQ